MSDANSVTADALRARIEAARAGNASAPAQETVQTQTDPLLRASLQGQAIADSDPAAPVASQAAPWINHAEKSLEGEIFYHAIAGSKFHYQTEPGILEELIFLGGKVTTNHPKAVEALRKVADKPGTMITSDRARAASMKIVSGDAAADLAAIAVKSHERMVAAGEKTY